MEKNFRVKTDRESRALAGLSILRHKPEHRTAAPRTFQAYLGVQLRLVGISHPVRQRSRHRKILHHAEREEKDEYNARLKQFWLSMGGKEDIAYNNCQIMMKRFDEIGINTATETPGGHTRGRYGERACINLPCSYSNRPISL